MKKMNLKGISCLSILAITITGLFAGGTVTIKGNKGKPYKLGTEVSLTSTYKDNKDGKDPKTPSCSWSGSGVTGKKESAKVNPTEAGTVSAKATYSVTVEKDGKKKNVTYGSATESIDFVEVKLTLEGKRGTVGENCCFNAQKKYETIKYKATVLPAGTSAKLTLKNCSADIKKGITNGNIITITPDDIGTYSIKLVHDDCKEALDEKTGKAFELYGEYIDISAQSIIAKEFSAQVATVSPPKTFSLKSSIESPLLTGKTETNPVNGSGILKFKLSTDPINAFTGKVKSPLDFSVKFQGGGQCIGSFGITIQGYTIGGATSNLSFNTTIAISGLSHGDGDGLSNSFSAGAPRYGILSWDHLILSGTSSMSIPDSILKVDDTVTIKYTHSLKGEKGGLAPKLARYSAAVESKGFKLKSGIMNISE